ncbi:MAG: helix-turn-helix transcriptional regulator [Bacteroidetes bacterium]|nr:helix-turn-helix transcriptional regulator [Bacteroidota bacterium]
MSGNSLEFVSVILIWQALLFAALFGGIYNKTKHYPKKFIAWYMASNAAYFSMVWMESFGYTGILRFIFPLAMPLLISFLPLFYYYFRSLTTLKYRVRGKQYYHLLPSVLVLILHLPFFSFPAQVASDFLSRKPIPAEFEWLSQYLLWAERISFYGVFTLQFLFYIVKFRTNLKLHRLRIELMFSYKENVDLRWMKLLFIGILLFFVGNDLIFLFRDEFPWFSIVFYSIGMIGINFFIGYHSLIQNELVENEIIARMTHYCALHREMTSPKSENQELFLAQELQKYQRSTLKTDTREQILQQLEKLMEDEDLYSDSKISIEDLAMKLSISSKNLSQAINEVYQKNFFNYINEYRIRKAKAMLESGENVTFSIEGIARMVGFQSKSSFYTAFKKSTGITPTEYRANYKEGVEINSPVR